MAVVVSVFSQQVVKNKKQAISRILSCLIIYLGVQLLAHSNRLPFYLNEPLSSVDLLGVAPYRVYLISLQPYLYILSVALVLFAKANDGRYPLYCSLVSGLSSPRHTTSSDKRPALGKGKTLLIKFVLQVNHPNPFFYF